MTMLPDVTHSAVRETGNMVTRVTSAMRVAPRNLSSRAKNKKRNPQGASFLVLSGKTGIRTLGARKDTTVFETVPIDHSGIFPIVVDGNGNRTATLMRSQRYERFLALRKFLTVKIPYLCP